jgi:hypothetical protein
MALPVGLANRSFLSVISHIAFSGDTDVNSLTRWLRDEYVRNTGGNWWDYNWQEFAAVARSALAGEQAAKLYTDDPSYTPRAKDIPRLSTIPADAPRYQYRVLVTIDGPGGQTSTAVTVESDTILSSSELYARAVLAVQTSQIGQTYLTRVAPGGEIATYAVLVMTVGQRGA